MTMYERKSRILAEASLWKSKPYSLLLVERE
jgi:hypothetical protein